MGWRVARMEQMTSAYNIQKEQTTWDWIQLVQAGIQWWALVNTVTKLRVP